MYDYTVVRVPPLFERLIYCNGDARVRTLLRVRANADQICGKRTEPRLADEPWITDTDLIQSSVIQPSCFVPALVFLFVFQSTGLIQPQRR